jgi:hypothetical protein
VIEAGSYSGGIDQANGDIGNYTAYTARAVPPGVYYVRIRAIVNGVKTVASNEIIVSVGGAQPCGCASTLAAPAALSSVVSGSNVTLNWSPSIDGPSSYVVEAGSYPGASNLANFDTLSTGTTYFAPGVGAGTYFVRVRAKNACGVSGGSNEIIVAVGR